MNLNKNRRSFKTLLILILLCLIPLVGAFVGIALILIGIKNKDKKYIIIGLIGILATISVYTLSYLSVKSSKSFSKSLIKITKIELTHLKKSIEFFKIEKGRYPENLEELKLNDKAEDINDPFLLRKMNGNLNTTLQYKKNGDEFVLFSVGIDGIPNTADDIYPPR